MLKAGNILLLIATAILLSLGIGLVFGWLTYDNDWVAPLTVIALLLSLNGHNIKRANKK